MQLFFIGLGFSLLFFGSYIDNFRGPLLPVLSHLLSLQYSDTSFFLMMANVGAVVAMFVLLFFNQHFRMRTVLTGVILFSSLSCLSSLLVHDKAGLFLFALSMGGSISILGATANLMILKGTDTKWRTPFFCGLHMMYGLGSLTGPLVLSKLNLGEASWQLPLLVVPVFGFIAIPFVFKKLSSATGHEEAIRQSLKLSGFQCFILLLFSFYVVGEVMTSMWLVTYLVGEKGMSVPKAAPYLSGFFLMMSLSRGALFMTFKESREKYLLFLCLALAVCFYLWGMQGNPWGFVFAGILGPFFPVLLSRLSRIFPEQASSITLWILASMQVSQIIGYKTMGLIADSSGIGRAYWIPVSLLFFSIVLLYVYFSLEKKQLERVSKA